jgi:hypothetical protein
MLGPTGIASTCGYHTGCYIAAGGGLSDAGAQVGDLILLWQIAITVCYSTVKLLLQRQVVIRRVNKLLEALLQSRTTNDLKEIP